MLNIFLSKFIEVLKNRRVELGYTQVEMAQFLSTSLRTYQRVELGESEPSFLFVLKSAEHLKLNLEEIFNYKSDKGKSVNLLMRSSRIIEKVAEKMIIGGWEYDVDTKTIYISDTVKKIRELEDNYTLDFENLFSYYDPNDQIEIKKYLDECFLLGNSFYFEKPITTKLGNRKYVAVSGHAEIENGKCTRIYGTTQDITIRKLEQERKFDIYKEHQEIQEFAGIGIWRLNIVDNILIWSDSMYKIFEIDPSRFGASYEAFLNLVHPEDRGLVDQAYTESLKNKTPYEIEHRLLLPDGKIKWLLESCHTDFDIEGRPVYSRGYSLDITRFKQSFPEKAFR